MLEAKAAKLQDAISSFLYRSSNELLARAKTTAPRKSGKLADSIVRTVDSDRAVVSAEAEYSLFVERGTAPHFILPRRGKALMFQSDGRTLFARRVHHPGTRGTFFMKRTAEESLPELLELLSESIEEKVIR